jgi:hypothetical protein
MLLPAALLASGAVATSRIGETAIVVVVCATGSVLAERLVAWPRSPMVPAIVTIGAHLLDLAFGSGLIVRSLLGPNVLSGARFHGIGNELEIALSVIALIGIGAAFAAAPGRTRAWAFALLGGALTLLLSWGRLGADVGASLTLGAGVATAVVASLGDTATRKKVMIVALVPVVAVGCLAAVDLATGGDAHFSRSILQAGGLDDLGDVFQRRVEASYGSLTRGIIPLLALVAVVTLIVGIRWHRRLLTPAVSAPGLQAGIYGATAAVIAGTLTNDSGPMMLLIGTLYLVLAVGYVRFAPGNPVPHGEHHKAA